MKKILATLLILSAITGSKSFANSADDEKFVEYDTTVSNEAQGLPLKDKLNYLAPIPVPTFDDKLQRIRNITAVTFGNKLTDQQWLLVRNFLGYPNTLTALETRELFNQQWRVDRPRKTSDLQLATLEAAIGRALIHDLAKKE